MKYVLSFTLRISEDLHKKLCVIAEKEQRSLNSQILYIIRKYIEEYEKNVQKK